MTDLHSLQILYEDNHLVVVNKRPGDLVQGDKTGDKPLINHLKEYIKEKFQKPGDVFIGTPHRIDRPTSGIVVFCRNSRSLERINLMFKEKTIHKTYWAVVKEKPVPEQAYLTHYLKKNHERNKSFAYPKPIPDSLRAELEYKIIGKSDNYFLLEVKLYTGRHHQIRVQLSTVGCHIKGDVKYGFDRKNDDDSIHLHARRIEFIHPMKKTPVVIEAPVPDEQLWKFFENELSKQKQK